LASQLPPDVLAIRLRQDLGIAGRQFDLLELARSMEFGVCYSSIPGGAEGLSTSIGGREVILINSEMRSERRQRFTLAHELGHCLLRHPNACRPQQVHGHSKEPEERAANQFAASLLMPPRLFREDIKKVHPRMEELSALADSFGVSRTAATLRYVQYTNDNCAVVGVTTETCWLYKSSSIQGWWVRNSPPEGSLIKEYLSNSGTTMAAEIDAAVWIDNFHRRTPCRIREEIAPAGPGSWIVVLSEIPDPDDDPDLEDREADEELKRRRNSFSRY
jgi:Zn-dependent peptidase ImmA (M78 family)